MRAHSLKRTSPLRGRAWLKDRSGLNRLPGGNEAGASGVAHGELLIQLAEAVVSADEAQIAPLRDQVVEQLGGEALVDAVAVVGNFQRMVRVADSTGIPIDDIVMQLTDDFRADLGVESFQGARKYQAARTVQEGHQRRGPSGHEASDRQGRRDRAAVAPPTFVLLGRDSGSLLLEEFHHLLDGRRAAVPEALPQRTAEIDQELLLFHGLNAFGDHI